MITKWLKQLLDERIYTAFKAVYDEIRILRNHRRGASMVRRKYANRSDLRIHFGCGPIRKLGWINTDLWAGPWAKPDFCVDVARKLPFEEDSAIELYSEHMFEHLDYPKTAFGFLKECYRVLAPGGRMTIGVPDVEPMIMSYAQAPIQVTQPLPSESSYCVLGHPLERLNYYFHQGNEHKFLYSFDCMRLLLLRHGFFKIERRDFDATQDSEWRRHGTLYVVCQKSS